MYLLSGQMRCKEQRITSQKTRRQAVQALEKLHPNQLAEAKNQCRCHSLQVPHSLPLSRPPSASATAMLHDHVPNVGNSIR
jgi:hypothetical protein